MVRCHTIRSLEDYISHFLQKELKIGHHLELRSLSLFQGKKNYRAGTGTNPRGRRIPAVQITKSGAAGRPEN
jgi:hypothetical protein